jgi:hypothetical protein
MLLELRLPAQQVTLNEAHKMRAHVRVGSWLCKNAWAEALTPGALGAVAGCNDFPKFAGFRPSSTLDWDFSRAGLFCNSRRPYVGGN